MKHLEDQPDILEVTNKFDPNAVAKSKKKDEARAKTVAAAENQPQINEDYENELDNAPNNPLQPEDQEK